MASRVTRKDLAPTLAAAHEWIERCLIDDGSVLTDNRLWTAPLIGEVKRAFVDHPDTGPDSFMDKLRGQLKSVSRAGHQLAAEMLWSLLLFPSNISPDLKRRHVQEVWEPSGEQLRPRGQTFDDEVVKGIGSGGTGSNNYRPLELAFLIAAAASLKQRTMVERRHILTDYDAFMDWIDTIPSEGNRQFPRMLLFRLSRSFARVERGGTVCPEQDRSQCLGIPRWSAAEAEVPGSNRSCGATYGSDPRPRAGRVAGVAVEAPQPSAAIAVRRSAVPVHNHAGNDSLPPCR